MNLTIPDTVLSTLLDDEAVLLNLETGEYFGLNEVGMSLWRLLSAGQSLEAARTELLETYDVDDVVLQADLEALVKELVRHKLVMISDG